MPAAEHRFETATNAALPWNAAPLRALLAGEPAPALVVHGPAGIGKAALVFAYAQALLCERNAAGEPACGECNACSWTRQRTHPDLRWISPAGDGRDEEARADGNDAEPAASAAKTPVRAARAIKLPQVQALAEFIGVGGHRGGRRVVVLDPADALNVPAANALLKTLEEPPAGAVFLLVTARVAMLLPTIRSRCRQLPLQRPAHAQALEWLCAASGLAAARAEPLLAAAGGAPLGALALADDAHAAAYRALLDAISRLPDTGLAETADAVASIDPVELVTAVQRWLADVARVAVGAGPLYHVAHAERLAELARRGSSRSFAEADRRLARQRALAEHPLNPRLFVEETLHGYARAFATLRRANGERS